MVEEIGFKGLARGGNNLLHVVVCCKSLVSQVLFKGWTEWQILDANSGLLDMVVHNILPIAP